MDIAEEGNNDTIKPRKTKRLKWVGDAAARLVSFGNNKGTRTKERAVHFVSFCS